MSKKLAELTEKLVIAVHDLPETKEGNAKAAELLREFTAHARTLVYATAEPLVKNVIIDDIEKKIELSEPVTVELPSNSDMDFFVIETGGCMHGLDFIVEMPKVLPFKVPVGISPVIPIGSVIKQEDNVYVVTKVEPVWSAGGKKLCQCQVTKEVR